MKKLSKITESIWSDIQDRSAGDAVRKEDDINLMSGEDFCDYLNDNYISKNKYKILYSEHSKCIHIPILNKFIGVLLNLSYDYKDNTITMNYDEVESLCPELCKKIKENFKVVKKIVINPTYTQFIIFPSDGSECTNRFFVDVVNFIIDNADENVLSLKKKHINESIWSDIQDRSMGKTVRKEDDIDHLDYEEFFVYLTEHYQPKSKKDNEKIGGRTPIMDTNIIEIFIPIESIDNKQTRLQINMSKKYNSIVLIAASPALFNKYVNLEKMLSNNYTLNDSRYLEPKKKPTNQTVVNLIDMFIDVVDNPILEKVS